ncbi:hypothetical protein HZS_3340, partial [Henneguya salminicola]
MNAKMNKISKNQEYYQFFKSKDSVLNFIPSNAWSHINEEESIAHILKNHATTSNNKNKKRALNYLGYVTPWNVKGSQFSLQNAQKFSMISPVWLEAELDEFNYFIQHRDNLLKFSDFDIDNGVCALVNLEWLQKIRSENPSIKISKKYIYIAVPRLLIGHNVYINVFNVSETIETDIKMHKITNYLLTNIL